MQPSPPSYIKALTILHGALLLGQLLLAGAFLFSAHWEAGNPVKWQSFSQTLLVVCIVLGMMAYTAASFLFRKRLDEINQGNTPLAQKLEAYRGISILRWALLQGVTLFSIIIFFLTRNYYNMVLAFALMFLFATLRPARKRIAQDLGVSEGEIE